MDERTRIEKLMAMALQDRSPEERDVAQAKLATMGYWPPPPKPPTTVAAPAGGWDWTQSTGTTSTANFGGWSFTVYWTRR